MQKYNKLENEILLKEKVNKHGILKYTVTMHRVATCTLQKLQSKLANMIYKCPLNKFLL